MSLWQQNQVPLKTNFFYGWIIVFISALGVFFSGPGQTYSVSIFINSFIEEFGWSRAYVSSIYSLGTLAAGSVLFLIGKLIDSKGHQVMMPLIAFSFGLALLWMSQIFHPLMLLMGFFLIRLLGQGSMTLVSSTLIPQWFNHKRGRALSFMALGSAASSSLLPPLNTFLIAKIGWRGSWIFWAILLIFLMAPLAKIFAKDRPEKFGLAMDGAQVDLNAKHNSLLEQNNSFTVKEARKTKSFWLILFCMLIPAMVNTGVTFHLISILGEKGVSALASAAVLSTMALVALPLSFVAGYLLDRFPGNKMLGFTFCGHFVLILFLLFVENRSLALLYGVLWGIVAAFENMSFNYIWPAYFGRLHLGSIRGLAMVGTVIGSAFGPLPFGIAFDYFGSYREIIVLISLFPFLGIFAGFLALKPVKVNR